MITASVYLISFGIEGGVEKAELHLDRSSSSNWSQGLKHCITATLFFQLFLKDFQLATHQLLLLPQASQFIHQVPQLVDANLGTRGLLFDVSPLSCLSAFVHICSNPLCSSEVGALFVRSFLAEPFGGSFFPACVLAGPFDELHGGFLEDQ